MNETAYAAQLRHLSDGELSLIRWHVLFDDDMKRERDLIKHEVAVRIAASRRYPTLDAA